MDDKRGETAHRLPGASGDAAPRLTSTGCIAIKDSWDQFLLEHGGWFHDRTVEAQIVYACPARVADHRLATLFQLNESVVRAEQAYSRLCEKCHAVAFYEQQPLVYQSLNHEIAVPDNGLLQSMKALGWTDEYLRQTKELIGKTDGVAIRLLGSLGRLVCSPAFCAEREQLRCEWDALASRSRPSFPLRRSVGVSHLAEELDVVKIPQEQADFLEIFDRFCDAWRINGMTSWELPDVDGPKWPQPELQRDQPLSGRVTFDTPWHFCLFAEDGLGELLRQEHELTADLKEVSDLKHWRTYGSLFQIDFWEQVINQRYRNLPRRRGFVTAIHAFIADIVSLDAERVQKLRKLRSALQRGKRTSLAGTR